MELGLKRGEVRLATYSPDWQNAAQECMMKLRDVLQDVILDIQHVGSTSIPNICAKPIIDVALLVRDFSLVTALEEKLKSAGFYNRSRPGEEQMLFACGSLYDGTGEEQTHFIHVVKEGDFSFVQYLLMRDFLTKNEEFRTLYENCKLKLASCNLSREEYTVGKAECITYILRKALVDSYLGKEVRVEIDRPIGAEHPKHPGVFYPINYGYIPGVLGGDGEELDVYLPGFEKPLAECRARVIAIVHRADDEEDKLVAVPPAVTLSKEEVWQAIAFQERFHESTLEMM